jgi:hypothetical protein
MMKDGDDDVNNKPDEALNSKCPMALCREIRLR